MVRALLVTVCVALASVAADRAASAQSRSPVQKIRSSPAHLVRDIQPGSDKRAFSMATPTRLGNRLVAWSLTNPNSCYPYLWSVDTATGQSTLLKEISPPYDPIWWPETFVSQAGRLYFQAKVPGDWVSHLWSTDGTPEGTLPVQGPGGLGFDFPASLTSFGGYLYFFAGTSENSYGTRFWRIDGTPEGTVQVGDVRGLDPQCIVFEGGGGCGTTEPPISILGGRMIFVGLSPHYPKPVYALFSSDGTSQGTDLLLEFDYGVPYEIARLGEIGYFEVEQSYHVHGSQLWRTDGTRAGTWMVKDMCPGGCSSSISYLKAIGQALFFFNWDGAHSGLWKSDGTEAGTVRLGDVAGQGGQFYSVGGLIFFVGHDDEHGDEIWRTDGTAGGTRLIKDVHPGPNWAPISGIAATGPYLFFFEDDGIHGPALWRTDGTDPGTVLLKETQQARGGAVSDPLVSFGNSVYFSAEDPAHGLELWSSDGTIAGTGLVADAYPGAESSEPFVIPRPDLRLLFLARGPEGVSLWDTDGSPTGIRRIARIDSGAENRSSYPGLAGDVDGQLFFFTREACACNPSELWVSDGTEAGTVYLETVHPTSAISAGGSLYFNKVVSVEGPWVSHLYRIDGRSKAITKIADTEATNFTLAGDTLYFTLDGALWRAEPGRDEIVPVNIDGVPVMSSGGALYLLTGGSNPGLWRSDGTGMGTARIQSGSVSRLTNAGSLLYYLMYEPSGISLWSISAWAASSTLARRFSTPINAESFSATAGAQNLLFFLLREQYQWQLWRSDGTEAGTYRLSEITASGPLVADATGVYFVGFDLTHGSELWHSSGTPETTTRVKDIYPGPGSSSPTDMRVADGVLVFDADDGIHGRELWLSDGTEEGTLLLDDICPGACSSQPAGFIVSGTNVFFSADDGETGTELWAMPLSSMTLPRRISTVSWRP